MRPKAVFLETFGCQMNELDSELVAGQLRALGYRFVSEPEAADVVLYNTCSVREHAEQKVWSRLGLDRQRKETNPSLVVGVLGCMAERDGAALIKRMPQVDILCGPAELDKLPALIDNAVRTRASMLSEESVPSVDSALATRPRVSQRSAGLTALQGSSSRRSGTLAAAQDRLEMLDLSRAVSPTDGERGNSAYVRITRGCNKFCTYCVVPFTRGAEVHRPPEHILDECKRLADAGVVEITLLGQTVNHYRFEHDAAVVVDGIVQPQKGRSYKGGHERDPFAGDRVTTFADLLRRIHDEIPSVQRLRFVTSYPRDFGRDVLQAIRECPRICRYLHVPAQSGSNRMLQAMNRGYTVEEYLEFLDRAREILHQPEIGRPLTIAGDIIVGFSGETDADHEATKRLLMRARYKNCFIFKYSPRPGTVAFDKLADDVPEEVKRARNNELLALQQSISAQVGAEFVGQTLPVFIEGLSRLEQRRQRSQGEPAQTAASGVNGRAAGDPGEGRTVGLTIAGKAVAGHVPTYHHAASACEMPPSGPTPEEADLTLEAPTAETRDAMRSTATGSPRLASSAGVQITGRTDGDIIVHVDLPPAQASTAEALVGRIVQVRVTESKTLSLVGELLAD